MERTLWDLICTRDRHDSFNGKEKSLGFAGCLPRSRESRSSSILRLDEALQLLETDVFDGLQLHGEESREFCESLTAHHKPVLKALRLKNVELLQRIHDYPVFGFLIDSHREGAFGGTGERFEWTLLKEADLNKPLIVAGGLTPENVADAVRELRALRG